MKMGEGVSPMGVGVKLVVGVLFPPSEGAKGAPPVAGMSHSLWDWTLEQMAAAWGPTERVSEAYPFDMTPYYKNIAETLLRRFVSFVGLFPAENLAEWKRMGGAMEARSGPSRRVNVDPGFIDGAKLVLASTKDRAQRVPIAPDLYAEVTLRFRNHRWEPFDYTFPDFRSGRYDDFLSDVRRDWLRDTRDTRRKNHD